jgi:hypothetical protein
MPRAWISLHGKVEFLSSHCPLIGTAGKPITARWGLLPQRAVAGFSAVPKRGPWHLAALHCRREPVPSVPWSTAVGRGTLVKIKARAIADDSQLQELVRRQQHVGEVEDGVLLSRRTLCASRIARRPR